MSDTWKKLLIGPGQSIRDALQRINAGGGCIALVVDDELNLLGVVSDGDVRRGLLENKSLDDTVQTIMCTSPMTATPAMCKSALVKLMRRKSVLSVPLLDDNKVVGIESLQQALAPPCYENPVFLMAGGFGTRLRPLTDSCPKPMLEVGGKPILETILQSFVDMGFVNFYISTHYMPERITSYFGDGSKWGVNIHYIHEHKPLGTGGALGLLPRDLPEQPIIVMNGDVLTKVDFQRLLKFHNTNNADATMCVREYEYQVPYGVIGGVGKKITRMEEKPIQRFFVNAGIYVVSSELARSVAENFAIDLPDLLEEKIAKNGDVLMFPAHEYWLDIGQIGDFNKAQQDIVSLGMSDD
jgi:dTDP-glucose pyrophosphorylase